MGVFDDLKDSVTGSDSSDNSKGRHGRSSGNEMDFGSDVSSDLGGDNSPGNDLPSGNKPSGNNPSPGNNLGQQSPKKPGSRSQNQNNPNNRSRGGNQARNSPAQSPQNSQGQSRPQNQVRRQGSTNQGNGSLSNQLSSNQSRNQSNPGSNQASRGQQRGNQRQNSSSGQNGSRNFPNGQAGRPEPGSDQPQLSQNTQKKMENAGLDPSGGSGGNVADSREGIEELKAQNDQIIELLKRINHRL